MQHQAACIALGVAVGIIIAGVAVTLGGRAASAPWSVERVLYPAGTILLVPESPLATFDVPSQGGVLVGSAAVDHTSVTLWVLPANVSLSIGCPAYSGYNGTAWTYSVNESLQPGAYEWGAECGGFANVTITQPLELLTP